MKKLLIGSLSLLFSVVSLSAQKTVASAADSLPTMAMESRKTYEIGGIKVTGNRFSEPNAIIGVSGLKVGNKIALPGPDLQRALRSLWKLRLFTDVQIVKEKTLGDVIFLEIMVTERPSLSSYSWAGAKKNQHEDLNHIVDRFIPKGTIVTESGKANIIAGIEKYYREKGYLDATASAEELPDPKRVNATKLVFNVSKNKRVRINNIVFTGNDNVKASRLRKKMDKTHRRLKIFSSSKLISEEYEKDKKHIIDYYSNIGFRDARITSDSVWREPKGNLQIKINIDEGKRYFFRSISWKGNTIYDSKTLTQVLGIGRGDIYNNELLEKRLRFSQDGRDVSSLYMDNGYLFFNIDPVETAIDGDSIDIEMRMFEGPLATIDQVTIKGNDRTHEHVIRRELFTLPGEKFSRADIIRSQRQIVGLGYFNQENLGINTPVNAQRGTVNIEYKVEEKPSDQLELSAGWGGFGVVGTLGVSFNNFSARNMFNKKSWSPLPTGDGQRLSLRAQSNGRFFQSYTASFTEPWLGGKKPTSLTTAFSYTRYADFYDDAKNIGIMQGSVSIGRRLKWPDDNFISNTSIDYQRFNLNNYGSGNILFPGVTQGVFNNVNIQQTFTRASISDPLFPKSGSKFQLIMQATPPYSLLGRTVAGDASAQEKFRWVEFYKWRFNAEWYTSLGHKFVLKTVAKIGQMGYYNKNIGYSPFGRFILGGDGLASRQFAGFTGNEQIALRGYEVAQLPGSGDGGGVAFAKYQIELRYPISLNPSSTIYIHTFVDGGNVWKTTREFKPLDIRRSAGAGLRIFLPMFGTLGFDYGFGFDKPELDPATTKITGYGRFGIILGFEPD